MDAKYKRIKGSIREKIKRGNYEGIYPKPGL